MGHRGDELGLHLFVLADLQGHVVDVVHQFAHLISVFVFDLDAVAAGGDPFGRVRHHRHRLRHVIDEEQVRDDDQGHTQDRHRQDHEICQHDLPVRHPQRRHKAHHAHYPAIEGQRMGNGEDLLPGLRVLSLKRLHLIFRDGLVNVAGAGSSAGRQAGSGHLDAPGAADKLQFDTVLVLVGIGSLLRFPGVLGKAVVHKIIVKGAGQRLGLLFQAVLHTAVIIAGHPRGKQGHQQNQQYQNRHHRVDDPPLPQTPQPQGIPSGGFSLRHNGTSSPDPSFISAEPTGAGSKSAARI